MQKTQIGNNEYIFTHTTKEKIRLVLIASAFILFSFGITYAGFSALVTSQMEYDTALKTFEKESQDIIEAREILITAEKNLAKEKISVATEDENWDEVDRLNTKLKELDQILENKQGWTVFQ